MLSSKFRDFSQTLTFRLALLYTGVFALSAAAAFVVCYLLVSSHLLRLGDEMLIDEFHEFREIYNRGGMAAVNEEILLETKEEDPYLTYFRVISSEGKVIRGTDTSSWVGLEPDKKLLNELEDGDYVIGSLDLASRDHGVRFIYGRIADDAIFDCGLVRKEDEEFLSVFSRILIVTGVVMSALSMLVGWLMSRRALAGFEDVTRTALEIQAGGLDKRVPLE